MHNIILGTVLCFQSVVGKNEGEKPVCSLPFSLPRQFIPFPSTAIFMTVFIINTTGQYMCSQQMEFMWPLVLE